MTKSRRLTDHLPLQSRGRREGLILGQRGTLRHRVYADRAADVGGALVDVVSNIWTVKAFSAHSRERRGFAQLLHTETTAHRDSLMYIE
jgi:ATP-binding cassette subfamily B protein